MKVIAIILFIMFSSVSKAWELRSAEDDIAIYTQYSDESGYEIVKIESVFDESVETLVSINTNAETLAAWMDTFSYAEVVSKTSWYNYLIYAQYSFPWPYKDRDSVTHSTLTRSKRGTVTLTFKTENEAKEESDEYIRMEMIEGSWEFIPLSENKTKVIYISHVSPGGNGPKLVINFFAVDVPLNSIEKLKQFAKDYKGPRVNILDIPLS